MIGITIKVDTKPATRFLTDLQKKQIPFATAQAITRTLQIARKDVIKQLDKDIDRPTPWTRRGFRVDGANKRNLTGRLFVLPNQERYLQYQIFGGVRIPKGTSLAMKPAKSVPGDIQRNKYGNIPRTKQAKAQLARGAFSGTVKGIAGIWQAPKRTKTGKVRKGSRMKLVLAYEPMARYRKRYRFFERGQNSIRVNWPRQFSRSWAQAMRSARR